MAMPSGRRSSDPVPCPKANGTAPNKAASVVIMMGRKRSRQATVRRQMERSCAGGKLALVTDRQGTARSVEMRKATQGRLRAARRAEIGIFQRVRILAALPFQLEQNMRLIGLGVHARYL